MSLGVREGYNEDLRYVYNSKGNLVKKNNAAAKRAHRFDDKTVIENMQKQYAKESPITKAWGSKLDFERKVRQAKSPKKVVNKKAMAEAKKLLNR